MKLGFLKANDVTNASKLLDVLRDVRVTGIARRAAMIIGDRVSVEGGNPRGGDDRNRVRGGGGEGRNVRGKGRGRDVNPLSSTACRHSPCDDWNRDGFEMFSAFSRAGSESFP